MNRIEELIKEAKESLERLVKQANARKISNNIVVSRWDVEKIEKVFELLEIYEHKCYLQEEIMKKTLSDVRKQDVDFEDYYVYKEELEKLNRSIKESVKMNKSIDEYAKEFNPTKEGIEKLKKEYRETSNEIIPELDKQIGEISNQLKELKEERKAKYDRKCFLEELSQKSGIDIL